MVKIVADFVLSSSGHFRKVLNKRGGSGRHIDFALPISVGIRTNESTALAFDYIYWQVPGCNFVGRGILFYFVFYCVTCSTY